MYQSIVMTGFPIFLGFYLYSICFVLEYSTFYRREVSIVSGAYTLVSVNIRCENKYADDRLISSEYECVKVE